MADLRPALVRRGPDGLRLNYDPRLRDAVEAASAQPAADMWPLFEALDGMPVAVLRGANSDFLSAATVAGMRERRPDLIVAEVRTAGTCRSSTSPRRWRRSTRCWRGWRYERYRCDPRGGGPGDRAHPAHAAALGAGLDRIAGRRVWVKAECLQFTGSFKARGGWAAVSALGPAERARGVIAYSSGNHAQGVARRRRRMARRR